MNITKNLPYYDVLAVGKQLQVTVSSGGHALVEGYIGSVKFISQTVTATTNFGVYFSPVNFKVSNLTGIIDAQEIQPLIGYNPASISETGGTMSGVTVNNSPIGQTTPAAGAFSTLSASSTVSGVGFSNYLASPGGIGTTVPGIVKTSNLQATYTDSSGTPGNVTNNSPRGRAAFAAAGTSVVVTSSLVTATSTIQVSLGGTDATLTSVRVTPAAGSFTVTGNAAATAQTNFDFLVIN